MKNIRITSYNETNSRMDIRQAEYEKRKRDYFLRTPDLTVELIEAKKKSSKPLNLK